MKKLLIIFIALAMCNILVARNERGIRTTVFDGFNISSENYKIYGIKLVKTDLLHPLIQDFYVEDKFLLSEIEENWTLVPIEKRPTHENYQYYIYLEKEDSIYLRVSVNLLENYVEIVGRCYYFEGNLLAKLLPFANYLRKEEYKYPTMEEGRKDWQNLSANNTLFKLNDFIPDWANYQAEFTITHKEYVKERPASDIQFEIIRAIETKFPNEKFTVELAHENFTPHPNSPHEYWFLIKIENPKIYFKQKMFEVINPIKTYTYFPLVTFWKEETNINKTYN